MKTKGLLDLRLSKTRMYLAFEVNAPVLYLGGEPA